MAALALITGASSGIGQAFAERLAADGYDLIVVARRRDRLEALAAALPDVAVEVVVGDLASEDGVDAVAALCAGRPLSMLVNNAGVAHYMPMADLPADKARQLVHIKVVAPTMLTRAALAGMIARGSGTIVHVAGMIARYDLTLAWLDRHPDRPTIYFTLGTVFHEGRRRRRSLHRAHRRHRSGPRLLTHV